MLLTRSGDEGLRLPLHSTRSLVERSFLSLVSIKNDHDSRRVSDVKACHHSACIEIGLSSSKPYCRTTKDFRPRIPFGHPSPTTPSDPRARNIGETSLARKQAVLRLMMDRNLPLLDLLGSRASPGPLEDLLRRSPVQSIHA